MKPCLLFFLSFLCSRRFTNNLIICSSLQFPRGGEKSQVSTFIIIWVFLFFKRKCLLYYSQIFKQIAFFQVLSALCLPVLQPGTWGWRFISWLRNNYLIWLLSNLFSFTAACFHSWLNVLFSLFKINNINSVCCLTAVVPVSEDLKELRCQMFQPFWCHPMIALSSMSISCGFFSCVFSDRCLILLFGLLISSLCNHACP